MAIKQDDNTAAVANERTEHTTESKPLRYPHPSDCVLPALSVVAVGFWGELLRNGGDMMTQLRLDWGGW